MAIPDYETIMLPLLQLLADQKEHSLRQAVESLAISFRLSPDEIRQTLPSGNQAVFYNRVGWARTYLKRARLLDTTRTGHFQITERGLEVVRSNPTGIDTVFLKKFPEFLEFKPARVRSGDGPSATATVGTPEKLTPEEALQRAHQEIVDALAQDLLTRAKSCSPKFFESLVVQLLVRMGYGGSVKDAAAAVGGTGDEGIDGLIKEDALGLDAIYVQAKRWERTVGRPDIHTFVGALIGQHARKGVFITTSRFSDDAVVYASGVDPKVVLVDGERLAKLMIQYGIGVTTAEAYEIKKIDSDYFVDE